MVMSTVGLETRITVLSRASSNITASGVSGELVGEIEDCCGSVVVSCCSEKLAAEAGYNSGTQRKGNVRRWKPLPENC
jgi:hypothetical protein